CGRMVAQGWWQTPARNPGPSQLYQCPHLQTVSAFDDKTMITPTLGYDLDRDVRTLAAMAAGLKTYVYDSELYGLMPGDLPKLTVGGLLMRLRRLPAIPSFL